MELATTETETSKIALGDKIYDVSMFRACEQCGRCSSACPLTGVDGFNIRRIIRHIELDLINEVADSPLPWFCTTCGRCEEACPNGIEILDIIRILRQLSSPEWVPEGIPCVLACPVNLNIPGYLRLIAEGRINEAYALIREKVPFPGILGRACTHPCEDACRRVDVFNQPIAICALKRYVADNQDGVPEQVSRIEKDTGHKVAIVGAGPAGLTAAFYLRKKGHQVTVFEERSEPGGMMRYGIPAYRLPQEIVEKEIKQIFDLGIQLQPETKLGRDFDLNQLKSDGYEAVFLAVGAQGSRKIDLEGADLNDVFWGVDFLCDVREGKEVPVKDRVLVVGGGNVAIDVSLTTLRLGAKEVTMACLESREEMPANPWEIEQAVEEGVKLMPSWGPSRIMGTNGKVSGIELVRCTSVFDSEGNFCPSFDSATKEIVEVDQVILAIGQTADLSFVDIQGLLKVDKGLIVVDQDTQETDMRGVFAGGDVTKAPGTIIDAIAAGRRAASSIDKFLGGDGNIDETFVEMPPEEPATGRRDRGFADLKREDVPKLPVEERHTNFAEVDLCLGEEQAIREAKRCLQCDLELAISQHHKL
ncbi:MAG: FAD-dependent oxidoreductase [Deltaproteobacteria bacterium]|nr:FAD-dependent oxidoreductase [Deltaproteobacteria bacterium]